MALMRLTASLGSHPLTAIRNIAMERRHLPVIIMYVGISPCCVLYTLKWLDKLICHMRYIIGNGYVSFYGERIIVK